MVKNIIHTRSLAAAKNRIIMIRSARRRNGNMFKAQVLSLQNRMNRTLDA